MEEQPCKQITASALDRYNKLFNNQKYHAVAERLAADLRQDRESIRVSDAMNCLTDTALSLCQHSHYTDAWIKLATFCGQNAVSIPTIDLMHHYLLIYQQVSDTRADDFELTAKALLKANEGLDALRASVSCANGVHGWRGRMAYDLLAASDYLTQTAIQLLVYGNLSYIREKLFLGLRRIVGALNEGIRHSERPEQFDCHGIEFPTHQARQ